MKARSHSPFPMIFRKAQIIALALFIYLASPAASLGAQEENAGQASIEAQEKLKEDGEGFSFDTWSLVAFGIITAAFLIFICWLMLLSRKQAARDNLASHRFEYKTLGATTQLAKSAAQTGSDKQKTPSERLIERLEAVQLVKNREGAISFGKGGEREEALLIALKDGRRALVFNSLPSADEMQRQLSRADLAIVPGKGDEAVVVTSFGDFIANQFRL